MYDIENMVNIFLFSAHYFLLLDKHFFCLDQNMYQTEKKHRDVMPALENNPVFTAHFDCYSLHISTCPNTYRNSQFSRQARSKFICVSPVARVTLFPCWHWRKPTSGISWKCQGMSSPGPWFWALFWLSSISKSLLHPPSFWYGQAPR